MIPVAVFEDNTHLRDTLQLLLNSSEAFCCAGAYSSCDNILQRLEQSPAAIVLMDIEMPGMNGIDATRLVKKHYPAIHILIQTVFFEDEYIFNAVCAGASGYILKLATPADYLQALKDVQSGGAAMTPGIAQRVLALFKENVQPRQPVVDYHLSRQEKKVLELLVQGKSYKMIAADLFIVPDTVKRHITNIYSKLHVHSGTEAVAFALRNKIV
ncbi:MAG: response regulator transcription factor [Chitinophagaceae bacterium]